MLVFSHDLHLTTIIKGDGSKVVTREIEDDKEFKLLGLEDHDSKVNKPKMTTITHPSQLSNEVCHFSPTTTIFI